MVKRVEDAASIVDDELAEELEKRDRLVGKAETKESESLVVKADEEPAAEKMEDDEMEEAGPMSFAELEEMIRAGEMMQRAYSNWSMFQQVMGNILEHSKPDEMKARIQTALSEFGDRIGQLKAAVEDAYLIEPQEDTMAEENPTGIEQAVEMLTDAINGDGDRATRLAKAQEAFNALAEVVKGQIDVVAPPDPNAEINKAILERLDLIASKLAAPQVVQAPVQKSFAPTGGPVQPQAQQLPVSPMTGQPSKLRAMIERSVGMQ